ncbi:hypothetical protein ACJ72_03376 [Emergomyces africanus]|uniref:Uncharacterized protein n=1 Tax=Emergomyces africanus TaxID=1955775 RepID=A0A1B7NZS0_9EURO|nr:hypothetical protein ACJ72_03376 [Emergomyces africanus]
MHAILHAVSNAPSCINILAKLEPSKRTKYLEDSKEVDRTYARTAQKEASVIPCGEDKVEQDDEFNEPINRGFLADKMVMW